ncbi:hypothetical protein RRG08_060752 [Elysia crispata]|uniref:Uncharacterized protein n=1 Tax=Elysia crispata TaxID=231223 RepID=A0AAE1CXW0_9GAST|nr:hypothetical protein RRG08_060752 [Elysia crispata]
MNGLVSLCPGFAERVLCIPAFSGILEPESWSSTSQSPGVSSPFTSLDLVSPAAVYSQLFPGQEPGKFDPDCELYALHGELLGVKNRIFLCVKARADPG